MQADEKTEHMVSTWQARHKEQFHDTVPTYTSFMTWSTDGKTFQPNIKVCLFHYSMQLSNNLMESWENRT